MKVVAALRPLFVLVIISLLLFVSALDLGGCSGVENPPVPPQKPATGDSTDITASTQEPMTLDLSFPNGAPRVNQTAELLCVLNARWAASDNVTLKINLPDGIQLVSGNLSARFASMSKNDVKELKVVIKPTKVGNYTIEAIRSYVPRMRGLQPGPGVFKIHLSVSETSAEWGRTPPWVKPYSPPPPLTYPLPQPPAAPSPK